MSLASRSGCFGEGERLNTRSLPPAVAFLVEAAASAPSADNSQPWCFEWVEPVLTARVRRRGGFPEKHHATILALGAAAENLMHAMQTLGVDADSWFFGSPGADGVFARGTITINPAFAVPGRVPIWKQRHTNRLPYRAEVPSTAAAVLAACEVGSAGVRVLEGAAIRQAADWVRQASEVRFQTREVNEWFAASLRYGNSAEDRTSGLHVDTLALPPGGVGLLKLMSNWNRLQWLNRFRAYKLFSVIEAANFRKAPLVVAILSPAGAADAFAAGRCLQRVWLKAVELGLSAQPYYVVADLLNRLVSNGIPAHCRSQAMALQARVHAEYGATTTVHCMLRIGKPIRESQASGRLPLCELMCSEEMRS